MERCSEFIIVADAIRQSCVIDTLKIMVTYMNWLGSIKKIMTLIKQEFAQWLRVHSMEGVNGSSGLLKQLG